MSEHVVYGIRHHGPGSARSLVRALEELRPDAVLIEGPPEAEPLLTLAAHAEMCPPVAVLVYDPQAPRRCAFYPFAEFSPEWQAIQYALRNNVPARFMDLPQSMMLAQESLKEETETPPASEIEPESESDVPCDNSIEAARRDPLRLLAEAAGYTDSERWWEHLVEERQGSDDPFAAIREAMTALRSELNGAPTACDSVYETRREAWMRNTIRQAKKEFERIAVVCGAWHAPAIMKLPAAKPDNDALKGLSKIKVSAAWIPWTYGRLARDSGYGAGVVSPGWYDFLWQTQSRFHDGRMARELSSGWLSRVARLLREKGMDVSTAHVIEAVRLAEALSALRGRPLPGLPEFNESVQAVILTGDPTAMDLIHKELIVGERLGRVPSEAPLIPIQQDLEKQQKSLRLPASADTKDYDLDLRKPNDLERSRLLHRLRLLGVDWGEMIQSTVRGKGTFRESWRLQWQPEFAVRLIEAGVWGNTVESAAASFAINTADASEDLAELTKLVDAVLLADLEEAIRRVMARLDQIAAVAGDVARMMEALPPLARAMRYGNVRSTDAEMIGHVVEGIVTRICVGLGEACYSLDDEAAGAMLARIGEVNDSIRTLDNTEFSAEWTGALERLVNVETLHGLVAGRAVRILLDCGKMEPDEAGRRMSLALSRGNDPVQAGAWVEGFLQGSGMVLLHTDALWGILDGWICGLGEEAFTEVLPLLRRTFATFPPPERRMMGERVKRSRAAAAHRAPSMANDDFDTARAKKVLPILELLLDLRRSD